MKTHHEFSRLIEASDLEQKPRHETISATEAEMKALAKRFNVLEIRKLEAKVRLKRERGGSVIHVDGTLEAEAVQSCVVTLDPVPEHIVTPFSAWFADAKDIKQTENEEELLSEEDTPEEIIDGKIDIGEVVAQYMALSLDPYPRSEGADLDKLLKEKGLDSGIKNPFSVLEKLKSKE